MNRYNYVSLPTMPFGDSSATVIRTLRSYEEHLSTCIPNLDFIAYEEKETLLQAKMFSMSINEMEISAIASPQSKMQLSSESSGLLLSLNFKGMTTLCMGKERFSVEAGKSACVTKHITCGEDHTKASGIIVNLDETRLKKTYESMTLQPFDLLSYDSDEPLRLSLNCGAFSFNDSFRELCLMIERYRHFPGVLESLGVDELFYRNIVMMLFPEKFFRDHSAQISKSSNHKIITNIVEFANAHPKEPLKLSDLEKISGVCARTLQNLFKSELDCTPTQWLKTQRLKYARSLLKDKSVNINVTTAAHLAGFSNYSQFSKHYAKLFGELPSQTLQKA